MQRIATFLLLLTAAAASQAQPQPAAPSGPVTHCLLTPVAPAARAAEAALVLEAEVLGSQGFRAADGRIFTAHQLRVYKVLKGSAPGSELTLLTEGGTVGLDQQQLTNTLRLAAGEQGVFFLRASAQPAPGGPAWEVYASQQGFVRYDLTTATAADPFRTYPQLNADFYKAVAASTAAVPQEVQPNPALAAALARRQPTAAKGAAPVISTLAPLTLTAGTGQVLTISGSGFGAARGTVEFRNANDGGNTFTRVQDGDYVAWTDTQIRVRVPSNSATGDPAGTGVVRVTTSGLVAALSAVPVVVTYAATNVQDSRTGQRVVAGHQDQNGAGGLSFRFESSLNANTAASAAFQRALAAWRCQTGINWALGTPRTGRGPADDGENAVGFDSGGELPTGVLGRTTSYYRGCYQPDGTVRFSVHEVDMQLDDAAPWQFGPGSPVGSQLDFESVVLHELGHAQQLSHLILPAAVMHYAIGRGQRSRTLAQASDIAGGRFVLRTKSFVPGSCGPAPMLPAPLTGQVARNLGSAGAEVQWTTRAECFVQEFVVERAPVDTTAGWQRVGAVAAGAASGQYRLPDPRPLPGLSYYRLRLRRPDGTLDNARPVLVTDDATLATDGLRFFPNPLTDADNNLQLQYLGTGAGTLTLRFYDAVGRYLGGTLLDYQQGVNVLRLAPPGLLRAGWYIVRWNDSAGASGRARLVRVR
ncbi:matrixin family metalloprotease [Hymenobacter weizhouensis]|uniref:matrixin family metalloprotease n=1 Tax=Hymenobacter sp. YIM 151500-1 TaxID=2987689 RepID=UPI002226A37F|nr:matrixin family metalloprotease [Hymenobacter sp. YIM 151500-1]UYZ61989.1 matrixin family metalloprotease [Hymenobacter sp. YIM 151500-1]